LVGVPNIVRSLAERGHQVVLNVGGRMSPGGERFVQPEVNSALCRKSGAGTFGIVTYPTCGNWAFAPSILRVFRGYIREADFIALHSLYSFPVLVGYLLARIYHKPYGLWPHGVLLPFQRHVSEVKKRICDWIIARRILNQASVLFFSATGERDEVRPLGLAPPSVIIPHGIDVKEYTTSSQGRFSET